MKKHRRDARSDRTDPHAMPCSVVCDGMPTAAARSSRIGADPVNATCVGASGAPRTSAGEIETACARTSRRSRDDHGGEIRVEARVVPEGRLRLRVARRAPHSRTRAEAPRRAPPELEPMRRRATCCLRVARDAVRVADLVLLCSARVTSSRGPRAECVRSSARAAPCQARRPISAFRTSLDAHRSRCASSSSHAPPSCAG